MSGKESFGIMDDCYFVPRTEILDWLNNLLDVIFHSFSWISPKSSSWVLARSIVKSLMSSTQGKWLWARSTGELKTIMSLFPIWRFSKLPSQRWASRDMWRLKNWPGPSTKTTSSLFNGSRNTSIPMEEPGLRATMPMKEGEVFPLILALLKRMWYQKPIMGLGK